MKITLDAKAIVTCKPHVETAGLRGNLAGIFIKGNKYYATDGKTIVRYTSGITKTEGDKEIGGLVFTSYLIDKIKTACNNSKETFLYYSDTIACVRVFSKTTGQYDMLSMRVIRESERCKSFETIIKQYLDEKAIPTESIVLDTHLLNRFSCVGKMGIKYVLHGAENPIVLYDEIEPWVGLVMPMKYWETRGQKI